MISAAATALARGPLARAGGAVVVEVPGGVDELRRDVGRGARDASRVRQAVPRDVRKGDPDRSLLSITGGPGLEALYRGWELADLVTSVTGAPCVPLGSRASYSGYGPGDHLGVHRDIPGCDVTVIVVVDDTGDERGRPHPLWTWAERATDDLATIRATPRRGRQPVRARTGEAIVVIGSVVPHQLPTLPARQRRVVAPLCFTAVDVRSWPVSPISPTPRG